MKLKIAILYGGPSSEHEVSVNSAKNVISHIDRDLYEVIEIFISKDGFFHIGTEQLETHAALKKLKPLCDVVFPVLHGNFGEDGKLQKILEDEGIKFVGSGSTASATAMDKNASNTLFEKSKIVIPKSQIISKDNHTITISFPIIVKPINEGSSVGLSKHPSREEFEIAAQDIFASHTDMLAQEYIIGREFTCGVIEIDGKNVALPASEIILNNSKLFDYKTKYTAGECLEVTPAHIPADLMKSIQDTALKCHKILGCKSLSRTDLILTNHQSIYVLETNTLPGMTKTSFIPAQAQAFGLSMKDLITALIKSAEVL